MRLLFELDSRDYDPNGMVRRRPSVRGIVIRGGKVAMIHSLAYDYYKFPGGGIEEGESQLETLVREVKEETGLTVVPGSAREYGWVHRVEKGHRPGEDVFIQENYYYLCDVLDEPGEQALTEKEQEERFVLEFVEPSRAVRVNEAAKITAAWHKPGVAFMAEREAGVLGWLIREGYLPDGE